MNEYLRFSISSKSSSSNTGTESQSVKAASITPLFLSSQTRTIFCCVRVHSLLFKDVSYSKHKIEGVQLSCLQEMDDHHQIVFTLD
jgi:hypothetical protein